MNYLFRLFNKEVFKFVVILLISWILFSCIGYIIIFLYHGHISFDKNDVICIKVLQACNSIGIFIIPPLLYIHLRKKSKLRFFKLHKIKWSLLSYCFLIVIFMALSNSFLEFLNKQMPIPNDLSFLHDLATESKNIMKLILHPSGIYHLLSNILVIAIIPSVGEELFFRGIVLTYLRKYMGVSLSIFISSFMFSLLHLNIEAFLPILFSGCILGYIYVYSDNLSLCILIHFINNTLSILMYYLFETELQEQTPHWSMWIIGFLGLFTLMIYLPKLIDKKAKPKMGAGGETRTLTP
ncbi:CPBP family intramembrane glutamic endopeptidase [Ichthyobacterium seriolicida]|uniref:CPBP family intramembrane glutamic endopeptidase n=1 Tax=Ichthyobacterium seriolicida TaxID=242600 RepID=UPI0012FE71FB|nr:CPBP family intramembrane glutamic endopeptidase [Ichthyobacterium seriolicida]